MQEDFYLGAWLVQPSLGRVSLNGRIVQVRPKVMDLLAYLARSPGTVVSKETLLNNVWGTEAVSESALTRTITELRNAVGDDVDHPRFLETIPKRGYRLVAPVRPAAMPGTGARTHHTTALATWIAAFLLVGFTALMVFRIARWEVTAVPRVKPLTTWPGEEGQPRFSPNGQQIAVVWSGAANDNLDIYLKRIDEDSSVRLTTDPQADTSPAWSPDGRAIAFIRSSNRGVGVYVVPAAGGTERQVAALRRLATPVRARILDWCGDGRALIVVDRNSPGDPFHIVRVSLDSGTRDRITSPPRQSYGDIHPEVSPDGQMLAFTRAVTPGATDLYVLPISGGEPTRLTFDNSHISGLTWSEDGRSIVFSSERGAMAGTGSLWRVRVDKSLSRNEPKQLSGIGPRAVAPVIARQGRLLAYQEHFQDTNVWRAPTIRREPPQSLISSTREEVHPDYSPDGARVAFASNRTGNWEVWTAHADGSNPTQVTSFAAAPAWHPRWSPDGRLIAFDHPTEGNADIHTTTPEGNSQRVTWEPSQEVTPSWSGDGRSLYFSSNRTGTFEIWKMDIDRRDQVVQITHHGGTNPLESPDRKRLFYTKRAAAGLEIWSTKVNGGDEVRVLGPIRSPAGWVPTPEGLYFIEPASQIVFHRFATGDAERVVAMPKDSAVGGSGLALSPDGRWLLFGQMDRSGADIILVENFR
jgi:Tol biopolymer transport system component/DNA-binding winged helix-turn-helix (wHTH) protein